MDSYKAFFDDMINNYTTHYMTASFKEKFKCKLDTFNDMKKNILSGLQDLNSEQEETKRSKQQIETLLDTVHDKDRKIREKVARI